MNMEFNLPKSMESLRETLAKTLQSYIEVVPRPVAETTLWQSKVGGQPYLPRGTDFPKTSKGEHLAFLAQINFEETPPMSSFPRTGILQFYIHGDDMYGLNFDNPTEQDLFRVLFFEKIEIDLEKLTTDFSFLGNYTNTPHSPNKSFPLDFLYGQEIISTSDYRFEKEIEPKITEMLGDEGVEEYYEAVNSGGHKLGGYPYFTQYDVRSEENEMMLLFQLDSDDNLELMWGDVGVANFFIKKEDLEKRDFSKVLYNWDCT